MHTTYFPTVSRGIPGPISGVGGGVGMSTHPLGHTHAPPSIPAYLPRHTHLPQKGPGTRDAHQLEKNMGPEIPHLTDWHTPVKTLPSHNYCCGR